jgi:hypothetical protein
VAGGQQKKLAAKPDLLRWGRLNDKVGSAGFWLRRTNSAIRRTQNRASGGAPITLVCPRRRLHATLELGVPIGGSARGY